LEPEARRRLYYYPTIPRPKRTEILKRFHMVILILLGLLGSAASGWSWPGPETSAKEIKLAGHIEATETDLAFQVPGRIETISFEPGEEVKAGQVVAKIDDKVLRQEVDAAQGAWEAADASPNPKKLKDAELRQARAALELAKLRLGYATLTAPVSGLVLARSANPGELAAVGTTIITLGDLDNVWFEGYLPEKRPGEGALRPGGGHHHRFFSRGKIFRHHIVHFLESRVYPEVGGNLPGAGNHGLSPPD
jgi:multidrug resistance efflux pump